MIYLLASIFFSTSIAVVFKVFTSYKIDLLAAIIVNYLVCYACGMLLLGVQLPQSYFDSPWFLYALGLGIFFIVGFNFIGITVRDFGIATATLMQKMSVALSAIFAILFFTETLTWLKGTGILLSLASILIFNSKGVKMDKNTKGILIVPFLTWLISGCIEIGLMYPQKMSLINGADAAFVSIIFLTAGCLGLAFSLLSKQWRALTQRRNIIAGTILGVPNFFSMYYLVLLLGIDWDASISLPINNVGILIASGLAGYFIFKENYQKQQWTGLALALVAIFLLSWA